MEQKTITLIRELLGHKAGIECMAFSTDGSTLLSGDDDSNVIIWNLSTGEVIQRISCVYHGAISAVIWININDSSEPAFAFGCADGSLHIYMKKFGKISYEFLSMEIFHDGAIESLAFDPVHCRLASVGCGIPQVWKISSAGTMIKLNHNMVQKAVIARNVFFCDEGASIAVCYLESHEIICFSIEPWALKWSKLIPTRIGNSSLCRDDGLFIFVSNLVSGVDQYRFPSMEKIQSFPHAIETNYPLQVATVAKGSLIVCGGDNGFARVFDRRTGQLKQRLEHERSRKEVPIIATLSASDGFLIATGESGSGECKIRLWKEDGKSSTLSSMLSVRQSIWARLNSGLTAIQVIALGAIFMICWHLFVALWSSFLNMEGVNVLRDSTLRIWKLARTSITSVRPANGVASVTPEPSPSILVVTQTSFATVTSVIATIAEDLPPSATAVAQKQPSTIIYI